MEHLYSTDLIAGGNPTRYNVVFENEKYSFQPDGSGPAFSVTRNHDEWHCEEIPDETLLAQAIKSLDSYLLKQH